MNDGVADSLFVGQRRARYEDHPFAESRVIAKVQHANVQSAFASKDFHCLV